MRIRNNWSSPLSLTTPEGRGFSVIDLQQWGELWEDFQDILVSRSRVDEPEVSWSDLQAEMDREN